MARLSRRALGGLVLAAAVTASGRGANAARLRMPAEWEPQSRCFLTWSAAADLYGSAEIAQVHREQAALAKAIAWGQRTTMLARAEDVAKAERLCGPDVEVLALAPYDVWARDTLPSFLLDASGDLAAARWTFNVWGEKFPGHYADDRTLAARLCDSLGLPCHDADLVCEGGAIDPDGRGTLLTTETCLLNPNRNPGLSKRDIDSALAAAVGARKVIWLPGSPEDAVTDGHIDGIARFVGPATVVCELSDDPEDPEYEALRENRRALEGATDADGRPLEVHEVLRPRWEVMGARGDDFAASYVNFFIGNGQVVMPRFGDAARDAAARDLIARLFPDRVVVQLRIDQVCEGGGGIHCMTQQVPLA